MTTALAFLVLVAYYALPWNAEATVGIVVRLGLGLGALIVAVVISARFILRARYPYLRAIELIVAVVAVAVTTFASAYGYLSASDTGAFSEELSRTDALYLAVTTATTVGYGDIVAISTTARVFVMLQMVFSVGVIGVAVRSLISAARRRVDET